MPTTTEGYREIEHTADWELEVWAPDLERLLYQAATGMYALMGLRLAGGPRQQRVLNLAASDRESLIVDFLGELLYLAESESIGFDRFDLTVDGHRLRARLEGARVASQSKEIKAVTYHRLEVRDTAGGLETSVVFDV